VAFLFLSGHEFQTGNVSNILLEDVMENVNTETRQRISLLTKLLLLLLLMLLLSLLFIIIIFRPTATTTNNKTIILNYLN